MRITNHLSGCGQLGEHLVWYQVVIAKCCLTEHNLAIRVVQFDQVDNLIIVVVLFVAHIKRSNNPN